MIHVTACSAFRDSTQGGRLYTYLKQMDALRTALLSRGDSLSVVWGEGDSADSTRILLDVELESENFDGVLLDVSHGGPVYGSVVHAERFRLLAQTWNPILDAVPDDADVVLIVESDLVWSADAMLTLIDQAQERHVVVPMVYHGLHAAGFYDTWAFVKDGRNFDYRVPFHPALPSVPQGELVQMDSAGSCLAMQAHYARECDIPAEDVIKGFCRQVYDLGGAVWLNREAGVYHP